MRRARSIPALLGAAFAAGFGLWASAAAADPLVVVHVAGSGEGVTVTVTDGGGGTGSCRTDESGSCEIAGLRPGRATVVAARGTRAGASQTVILPADGKVSLFVPNPT